MKALILGAGYGIRLYPLTANTPKPLLNIAGKPVIEWLMERLLPIKTIEKIYIVSNHLFYSNYERWLSSLSASQSGKIVLCDDKTVSIGEKLGAIGDINFVIDEQKIDDDLLVVAGDNLLEVDFADFIRYFKKYGTTIALKDFGRKNREFISQYGVVTLDEKNKVIDFEEKPPRPESGLVAVGLYLFSRDSIRFIREYLKCGFNPDAPGYYLQWLYKKIEVYGYLLKGEWFDMGDIDSYEKAGNYYLQYRKV